MMKVRRKQDCQQRFFQIALCLLFIASLLVISGPDIVSACSCAEPPSPQVALQDADAVFSGTVEVMRTSGFRDSSGDIRVYVQVDTVWKGDISANEWVRTSDSPSACGIPFVMGETYIFYGYEGEHDWETNLCSRTALLENAAADLQELGEGGLPEAGMNLPVSPLTMLWLALILIGGFWVMYLFRKNKPEQR